jgi:hypothetical protein
MTRLNKILKKIFESLNNEVLFEQIDHPLDMAMETFVHQEPALITHKNFNTLITKFYQHLNIHCFKKDLCDSEAFKEVSWLIEVHYRGDDSKGYDGAYYDAVNEGYDLFLARLINIFKSIERDKYVNWVIHSNIDPTDWTLMKKMVEEIFESYGELLPAELKRFSPAQLTPHLKQLILIISEAIL